MARIFYEPGGQDKEYLKFQIDDSNLEFADIKNMAKQKALEKSDNPMFLSWFNGKTGEFYPKAECGKRDKPSWVVYAESRGSDLVVDFNDGTYIFMLLKI